MITWVGADSFRCLKSVRHTLRPFTVLAGPNAAGKSTFLDLISILGDVIRDGPEAAVESRIDRSFSELLWRHEGQHFDIGIEAKIPERIRREYSPTKYDTICYSVRLGFLDDSEDFGILREQLVLHDRQAESKKSKQTELFEAKPDERPVFQERTSRKWSRLVIRKVPSGNDNFYSELFENRGGGWLPTFKFGVKKSALANIPDDGRRFPASTWLKEYLSHGVVNLVLNSKVIGKPSSPTKTTGFRADGSNLAHVIHALCADSPGVFTSWLDHVRQAIPDIAEVRTIERDEDRHRYIVVKYADGTEVPSWFVSDGTLRFMCLTILAYLNEGNRLYLIEEPENGIHPPAIDPLFQSLSAVYDSQVLVATHSTVALGMTDIDDLLCFEKSDEGTVIRFGREHPALKEWKGEVNLGTLIGSGILKGW